MTSMWLRVGHDETGTIWGAVRQMRSVAAISVALSLSIAAVESLAMAGLVAMLTAGSDTLGIDAGMAKHVAHAPVVLVLSGISLLLNVTQTWVRERVTGDWELARRIELIEAFRHADYSTQVNYSSGRLAVDGEYIAAGGSTIGGIIGLIGFAARALVYGVTSVVASWQVASVAVACGSVLVVVLRLVSRRTRALNEQVAKAYGDASEDLADLAPSSRELHALNRWDVTTRRLSDQLAHIRATRFNARLLAGMVGPVYAMGTLVVGVGVALWANRAGEPPTRLAISGLLLVRSLGSAQSTQVGFQAVNDSRPYMDRGLEAIRELRKAARAESLDEPSDIAAPVPSSAAPTLRVLGASVSYGNDVVVDALDLELRGTGGVALIGPSGAGKSTVLLSLSGLLRPDSGAVELHGVDLGSLDLGTVTDSIGYLPQDPRLIRASLRDNLLRWPGTAPDEQLRAILRRTNLLDTVDGFPGGLDSPMGRAAEGLSGGELQRLGLVRLALADPPVLLLDEPTSALDRANSEVVSELIAEQMSDHLVVLVTHRPDLLLHCTELVYLEAGRVIDRGTLDALAGRNEFVAAMAQGILDPSAAWSGEGRSVTSPPRQGVHD